MIVNLPIIGSSFALPFRVLTSPIIAKININNENKGRSIHPIKGMNSRTMFPITHVMKSSSP
jgi:hypothetical protein